MAKFRAITNPNLGLYLGRNLLEVPARAVQDGMNFRIKDGTISNLNLGWTRLSNSFQLNGPVTLIDNFFPRTGDEQLIFGTTTDLYRYDADLDAVFFITPTYAVGTASANGTAVTGIGTNWQQVPAIIDGGDEISFGDAAENDPGATWFTIDTVNNDTSITLTATAGVIGAGPYTIRRKFSGNVQDVWSFDTFVNDGTSGNDLWFATNGIEDIVTWNGTDATVTYHPELGFTCTALAVFSNMMIYANLVVNGKDLPTSIINSDVSLPLNAGSTGTGLSEQFTIHDGTDEILNLLTLGENLVAYSERHLTMMQFIGDPLIFLFRNSVSGIGPVSYNGIADFGDFHEFLGAEAQYSFDGLTVREINSQVWREIIRISDPVRKRLIFGHFDEENGDLIWSIPLTTDAGVGDFEATAEQAFSEHYLEDVGADMDTPYSRRALPFTASGFYERTETLTWDTAPGTWDEYNFSWNDQFFQLGFPQNIFGDIAGHIWILNESQYAHNPAGDDILLPSHIRFGRQPTSDGRVKALLKRLYPFATNFPGKVFDVNIYISNHAAGPLTAAGSYEFDESLPEEAYFVSIFRRGRYFEWELSSAGEAWQLAGYDIDIEEGPMV